MKPKVFLYSVFGLIGLMLAIWFINKEYFQNRQYIPDNPRANAEYRQANPQGEVLWMKINDDYFRPPLLNFANGCWKYGDDTIYMDMDSGDFYQNSKTNLRQEIWVEDFDKIYATYNGQRLWGGEWRRRLDGSQIRIKMDAGDVRIYDKVDCPPSLN